MYTQDTGPRARLKELHIGRVGFRACLSHMLVRAKVVQ
jgi:hypothetical protein